MEKGRVSTNWFQPRERERKREILYSRSKEKSSFLLVRDLVRVRKGVAGRRREGEERREGCCRLQEFSDVRAKRMVERKKHAPGVMASSNGAAGRRYPNRGKAEEIYRLRSKLGSTEALERRRGLRRRRGTHPRTAIHPLVSDSRSRVFTTGTKRETGRGIPWAFLVLNTKRRAPSVFPFETDPTRRYRVASTSTSPEASIREEFIDNRELPKPRVPIYL